MPIKQWIPGIAEMIHTKTHSFWTTTRYMGFQDLEGDIDMWHQCQLRRYIYLIPIGKEKIFFSNTVLLGISTTLQTKTMAISWQTPNESVSLLWSSCFVLFWVFLVLLINQIDPFYQGFVWQIVENMMVTVISFPKSGQMNGLKLKWCQ